MATKPLWAVCSLGTFIRKRKNKLGRDTGGKITRIASGIVNALHITRDHYDCPPQLLIMLGNIVKETILVSSALLNRDIYKNFRLKKANNLCVFQGTCAS